MIHVNALALGSSATLTNCFVVSSGGVANFASALALPGFIRVGTPATIYPGYSNTGDAPMPAPLLVLTVQQNGQQLALLTLDGTLLHNGLFTSAQPSGFSHSEQFLACGLTPGVLQPGESFQVPVYWAGWQAALAGHSSLNWNLGIVKADDPTPIDWSSLETTMQPSTISADAWNAIWLAFTSQVGSTWGSYVTMLDNNAAYLGRQGLYVVDISKLLAFQFMQVDGLNPLRTLANSVDVSVATPGLPLTFSRSFGESISQRYAFGSLGRGWSHNWQYSLQIGTDGTVTIFGPSGSQRSFQPNTLSGGYFSQAGDYGVLSTAGGGAFTLTEKSGLLY